MGIEVLGLVFSVFVFAKLDARFDQLNVLTTPFEVSGVSVRRTWPPLWREGGSGHLGIFWVFICGMMLGKRSRPIQKAQNKFRIMPSDKKQDPSSCKSSAFFLFTGFSNNNSNNIKFSGFDESEGSRSPTSPLDSKKFIDNYYFKQPRSPRGCWEKPGLGILAALHGDSKTAVVSPKNSSVKIFAGALENRQAQLSGGIESNQSPPIPIRGSRPPISSEERESAMEYSESYTCVTSHGPMPAIKQTYEAPTEIQLPPKCKPAVFEASSFTDSPDFYAPDFLSACYLCRRQLSHGKDIYMYRGDRAFCSVECRYQQIVSDEKKKEHCASAAMKHSASASPQQSSYYQGRNIFTANTMAAA